MAGRTRGQAKSSPPGETAEATLKKHRDKPSSPTNLAGGGGETGWIISQVVCGNPISKESEAVCMSCRLELVGVSLYLPLPQREALAEHVTPSHWCESCEFMAQVL